MYISKQILVKFKLDLNIKIVLIIKKSNQNDYEK